MLRSAERKLRVGQSISAEIFNPDYPDHIGSSRERIIHLASPEFGCANALIPSANLASTAWSSSQKPFAIPFRVFRPLVVHQFGIRHGSSVLDSIDIGIYDTSWNRKISTGATARSGSAQGFQWIDVADTYLPVGKYYLVICPSAASTNNFIQVGSAGVTINALLGCMDSATSAYPLPDPLTNMISCAVQTFVPYVLMAAREPF